MAPKKKAVAIKGKSKKKPTQRQMKFVQGVVSGKSAQRAALDAGYSYGTARNASNQLLPAIQESFGDIMRKFVTPEKIAATVAAGLEATTVKVATFEGQITDKEEFVDFGERRAYAELAAKLGQYHVPVERRENEGSDKLDELMEAMRHGPMPRGSVNPDEEEPAQPAAE